MKKIVFEYKVRVIDYTSKEAAQKDMARMRKAGIPFFVKSEGDTANETFGKDKGCYSVEYWFKSSKRYEAGF